MRCQAITNSGKRCRKSFKGDVPFCCVHDGSLLCNVCDASTMSIRLQCGHRICKTCIISNLCTFDTFDTNTIFNCEVCKDPLCHTDWSKVTDVVIQNGTFQRTIIYILYASPVHLNNYCITHSEPLFDKQFSSTEAIKLLELLTGEEGRYIRNEKLDVEFVTFKKNYINFYVFDEHKYCFKINYNELKEKNDTFFKELVEYIYHPSRMRFDI